MCALHHMPYPSQASESLFKNVRISFVEKSCRKASLYVHITTYIYKRHHFMNKVCGKCCHFLFVCLFVFRILFPGAGHQPCFTRKLPMERLWHGRMRMTQAGVGNMVWIRHGVQAVVWRLVHHVTEFLLIAAIF